ncbi:hypothetical protein ACTXT7_011709 [Hymenolepis weldensis]
MRVYIPGEDDPGLDWIDELNLIQFANKSETCHTPTLELTNGGSHERMQPMSACYQNPSPFKNATETVEILPLRTTRTQRISSSLPIDLVAKMDE